MSVSDRPLSAEEYFDTTSQAWFVPGFPMIDFKSQRDARQAMRLAREVARTAEIELADKVREVLP